MSNRIEYSQWLKRGPNTYFPTDNAETVKTVESGVYDIRMSQQGPYLFKKTLKLDNLIDFDSPETVEVLSGIEKFWEREHKFKEYGYVYKRGMLLYGPPGTGKTSLINILVDKLIKEHNGVIFTLTTPRDLDLYHQVMPEMFKVIEPNRRIITIIEDIDGFCRSTATETTLINILDGIEQSDNILYLATTNYPERIPKRLMNRPNRFDRRIKIGWPSAKVRRQYFESKLHKEDLENVDLNKWVKETENMSIAHLGELIKSVIILDNDFDDTIKLLRELNEIPHSASLEKGLNDSGAVGFKAHSTTIGFGSSNANDMVKTLSSDPQVEKWGIDVDTISGQHEVAPEPLYGSEESYKIDEDYAVDEGDCQEDACGGG